MTDEGKKNTIKKQSAGTGKIGAARYSQHTNFVYLEVR